MHFCQKNTLFGAGGAGAGYYVGGGGGGEVDGEVDGGNGSRRETDGLAADGAVEVGVKIIVVEMAVVSVCIFVIVRVGVCGTTHLIFCRATAVVNDMYESFFRE